MWVAPGWAGAAEAAYGCLGSLCRPLIWLSLPEDRDRKFGDTLIATTLQKKRSYKTHQVLGSNIRTHLQLSTGLLPTQVPWYARTTSHDGGYLDNDILGRQSVTSARLGLASLAMHLAR